MANAVITPKGRVSYPYVYDRAQKMQRGPDGEPQYEWRCELIFPADADLSALKKLVRETAERKWGDKIPKGLRNPIRECAEKDGASYATGKWFINMKSDRVAPQVVDQARQPIPKESGRFYAGCWARASVTAYAYDVSGNRGVSFRLVALQKLDDAEPFGDGVNFDAQSDFDVVEGFEATAPESSDVSDDIFA